MELVAIGKVVRPHGVRGAVFVQTDTGTESALRYLSHIWTLSPTPQKRFNINEAAWMPKGWKLDLEGVDSMELATPLINQTIWAERTNLEAQDENEYYLHDLLGCDGIDADTKKSIGKLESVESVTNSQQRWWFESSTGPFSVPARARHIIKVDIANKQIWLTDYEAFLPE